VGAALHLLEKFPLSAEESKEKSIILQDCLLKSNSNEQNIPHLVQINMLLHNNVWEIKQHIDV